jgi:hypothetical protein
VTILTLLKSLFRKKSSQEQKPYTTYSNNSYQESAEYKEWKKRNLSKNNDDNIDPSINEPDNPEATGASDYEEDSALLDIDEDTLW